MENRAPHKIKVSYTGADGWYLNAISPDGDHFDEPLPADDDETAGNLARLAIAALGWEVHTVRVTVERRNGIIYTEVF